MVAKLDRPGRNFAHLVAVKTQGASYFAPGDTDPSPGPSTRTSAFGEWSESDNHGFANELDYLRSLKKDDSYTFTYSFEYIAKHHGNGNYDIDTANMGVRVEWDDSNAGYVVSYDVPRHVQDRSGAGERRSSGIRRTP